MEASESSKMLFKDATHTVGDCIRCGGEVRWLFCTKSTYICMECGVRMETEVTNRRSIPTDDLLRSLDIKISESKYGQLLKTIDHLFGCELDVTLDTDRCKRREEIRKDLDEMKRHFRALAIGEIRMAIPLWAKQLIQEDAKTGN